MASGPENPGDVRDDLRQRPLTGDPFAVLRKHHRGVGSKVPALYVRLRIAAAIYRELAWSNVQGAVETAELLEEAASRYAKKDRAI